MQPTRRQALGAGFGAAAGLVAASAKAAVVDPRPAMGDGKITAQMKLSVAAYSFRDFLPRGAKKGTMTLHHLFDLAAVWRLDAVEPTSYYFTSEDMAYLLSMKAKAFRLGLDISGTAVGNNFCHPPGKQRDNELAAMKRWIDHATVIGAPVIRVFAGRKHRHADRDQAYAWAVDAMKESCAYAATKGVFLAIENHGYLTETADDVLRFVDAIDSEWFGVNLDTGNFDDAPYVNMVKLAPKALNVQVKVQVPGDNGKEPADYDRIVKILADANYRGYLALEYEAQEDPMTAVPKHLDALRTAIGNLR